MRKAAFTVVALLPFFFGHAAWADQTVTFGSGVNTFTIDFVLVSHATNRADTTGSPKPAGSVGYVYYMGKYEISREMITKANAAGGLKLSLRQMDFVTGGARPNMPATSITWNEAAIFVNWLNTSQGFPPAYKTPYPPGDASYETTRHVAAWDVADSFVDGQVINRFRHKDAHYFLPSTDEWYKAAYYDPKANGGAGGYWNYANGSDSAPTAVASGTQAGTAVYLQPHNQGPADITVAGGLSPFGVMAMDGNVYEWQEMINPYPYDIIRPHQDLRGLRGGNWEVPATSSSHLSFPSDANGETEFWGFRVASRMFFRCGDFDKDQDVDAEDLVNFLSAWTGPGGTGATLEHGDCDADGDVDSADLLGFLSNWTGAPEPE